jgi:tetratricopeptide (TPR) repeat protein
LDIRVRQLADANLKVTDFQKDLAESHHDLAMVRESLGQREAMLAEHRKALALQQQLADAHPTISSFAGGRARSHNNIGISLWEFGRKEEALAACQKALPILHKLVDAHPSVTEFQDYLAWSYFNIGWMKERSGQPLAKALAAYQKALTLRQKLFDANPNVTAFQIDLADCLAKLGITQRQGGWPAEAVVSFRWAVDLLVRLPSHSKMDLYNQACYQALLASIAADPGSGLTAAEGQAGADQAMTSLRRAVAAGFDDLANLRTDPDLDTLRQRSDFQKLLKEVEAKSKGR